MTAHTNDRSTIITSHAMESSCSCPVCNAQRIRPYLREGPYTLLKCRQCRFVFRQDRIGELGVDEEVDAAYRNLGGSIDAVNQRLGGLIIRDLKAQGLEDGSILDVGCGTGAIGKTVQHSFPELSYIGIEPSPRFAFADDVGGSRIHIISPEQESEIPPESQSALIFNHVLEHLPSPVEFVRRYLHFLKPGGLVYIEVPNE